MKPNKQTNGPELTHSMARGNKTARAADEDPLGVSVHPSVINSQEVYGQKAPYAQQVSHSLNI